MCGYWNFMLGSFMGASVIFPEPLWGIDRGWRDLKACRSYVKSNDGCRTLVEEMFRRQFPSLRYEWPACGKDDTAEAIHWAAVGDSVFVERYLGQLRRLCP